MAVGTALAIGGLVNAGLNAWGAHKASSAAKKAAAQQTKAADEALGVTRDVYNRQMYAMDPYANVGRQSMNVLGRLTSPGQPYTPQMQRYDARTGYTAYGGGPQDPMTIGGNGGPPARPRPPQGPPQGYGQPRMMPPPQMMPQQQGPPPMLMGYMG